MNRENIDMNEHWSYAINGNWRANYYYEDLFYICSSSCTAGEREIINRNDHLIPLDIWKVLIIRCYDKLIKYADEQKSRLAYLVLGMFLMEHGGKMTKEVKDKILKYSRWKYEKHQLKSKEEREFRKKYLFEFREKVINYVDGVQTKVTDGTLTEHRDQFGFLNLTYIDYKI
ncbi:MAG: hypothetical protein EU529_05215 [Promethearchaeota archaeon]|nr:MAG: hypothetical protein EU529_05215 [Candidatus Lokiarchaeota archaeon]